jgi:hypothetical protein
MMLYKHLVDLIKTSFGKCRKTEQAPEPRIIPNEQVRSEKRVVTTSTSFPHEKQTSERVVKPEERKRERVGVMALVTSCPTWRPDDVIVMMKGKMHAILSIFFFGLLSLAFINTSTSTHSSSLSHRRYNSRIWGRRVPMAASVVTTTRRGESRKPEEESSTTSCDSSLTSMRASSGQITRLFPQHLSLLDVRGGEREHDKASAIVSKGKEERERARKMRKGKALLVSSITNE